MLLQVFRFRRPELNLAPCIILIGGGSYAAAEKQLHEVLLLPGCRVQGTERSCSARNTPRNLLEALPDCDSQNH